MLLRMLRALLRPARGSGAGAPRQAPERAGATPALVRSARAAQYARDFAGAAALLEEALAAHDAFREGRERAVLLIELALCRLRCYRLDDAARLLAAARAADPSHPLLEGLAHFPGLLAESLALTRSALPPMAAGAAAARRPVGALYFFLVTPTTSEAARAGYFGLMRQSIASLRHACPGSRAMLLTDRATRVPENAGFDAILRQDLDARALVHSRLLALARALGEPPLEGDLVLLDPDTVIARDFRDVYHASFDLAFTLRSDFADAPMDHEPFNAGVIFVRAEGGRRARGFFELCVRRFGEIEDLPAIRGFYPQGLRAWRGDQVLPAAVVGRRAYLEHVLSGRTNRLEIEGCTVGFVESRLYNHSGGESGPGEEPPCILHLKGERKLGAAQAAAAA